ncbi:hypothetical protein SAMN05216480_10515 [Pustulibacterium marinum]|uniref:Uncharacterized protein n=1 Tax=Pustulibacterium marinum TaxID=1224947 RepID=A0A1I7GJU3_9FLAO|nr:hypothetical protein SAMN05216480_10515 [Pustulibacterium marinum]
MPKVTKVLSVEIKPKQFLEQCTDEELREIYELIHCPRFYREPKLFDDGRN